MVENTQQQQQQITQHFYCECAVKNWEKNQTLESLLCAKFFNSTL
jgi:hypothetical protein